AVPNAESAAQTGASRETRGRSSRPSARCANGNSAPSPSRSIRTYSGPMAMEDSASERDVLVLAKSVAAESFPVERPSVFGVDRESGRLERLTPFPWKNTDTDPPILRWSWIHLGSAAAER